MTLFVSMPIHWPRLADVAFRRDRVSGVLRNDIRTDRLSAVCLIAKNVASSDRDLAQQGNCMNGIVVVAGTEHESQWIA